MNWALKKLALILQPFVPHISEEMWSNLNNDALCIDQIWPTESVEKKSNLNIAIQINGKTKHVIEVDKHVTKDEIIRLAKNNNKIKKNFLNKKIIREIYVPGKIINFVT